MAKKGGYQIVNVATLTYALALTYLECGKPLLIEDGTNKPYYADSIEVDSDENVVIRKGASSIIVAPDGTITFNNVLNGALLENIVDKDGNKRFQDFELTTKTITGVTYSYSKASLSGTHLMFVIAGNIEDTTVIAYDTVLGRCVLPKWILDKIFPIYSSVVENWKTIQLVDSNGTQQVASIRLSKSSTDLIISMNTVTLTATRNFRASFDLLIDLD